MNQRKFTCGNVKGSCIAGCTLLLILFITTIKLKAQNVAINTDGSKANPNAIVDIKSADKGLLIPRMSTGSRLRIPAAGNYDLELFIR